MFKFSNEEIERMKTILKFPTFLNNPLSTIKQHILNTLHQKEKEKEKASNKP